jgi:uncharacterized protein
MKAIWISLALLLAAWGMEATAQSTAPDPSGDWRGTVSLGAVRLRAALHLGDTSTFDSPDQGVRGIPARMTVEGRTITVDIEGIGVFEGTLSADGNVLEGALKQGTAAVPIRFERGVFAAVNRPQTPVPPFPYRSEEVSYDNPRQPDVRLAGTLTLPSRGGPFPAVLLISGSGSQDRDATMFDHKPFLVLADALTRRGIAVLRVDDRGVGGSVRGRQEPTTADFATDVEAGLAWLRARDDIDPSRVGLIGHSEGALIAAMVASRDQAVAFAVLWAGPGVSGAELLVEQARALSLASGASRESAEEVAELQRAILQAVAAEPDLERLRASLARITASRGAAPIGEDAARALRSPWYRHFLTFDPAPALRNVRVPVLALLGGRDAQVPAHQNEPALRAALAGNRGATVEVLPGLNHLFQTARTGAPDEYGTIEETISPSALARMMDWLVDQTAQSSR